jgi:hypothetical protein
MGRVICIDNCVPKTKAQVIYFKNYLCKIVIKGGLEKHTQTLLENFLHDDNFKKGEIKKLLINLEISDKELLKKYIKNYNVNKNKEVKPTRKSVKHSAIRFDIPENKYKKLMEKLKLEGKKAKDFFERSVDDYIA